MSGNYYNEFNPFASKWLANLQEADLIPKGVIDTRSITEIKPDELNYAQCHFFAGIAGWPYALQLAGIPSNFPLWTGSCPCQPLSGAGKRRGQEDERHLWPTWFGLIEKCRPAVIFGEQVASKDGREWFCGVRADLESLGYAVGAADLCAAGIGAPHIRQRLFWAARLADANPERRGEARSAESGSGISGGGFQCGLANTAHSKAARFGQFGKHLLGPTGASNFRLGDANSERLEIRTGWRENDSAPQETLTTTERPGAWSNSRSILCRDGKTRRIPTEPALFPLAARLPNRVGALRGAGNAIVPQVAAEFIKAVMGVQVCESSSGRL